MIDCYKITDERFSSNKTDFYNLVIEVSFTRFRFLVYSADSVIWLEDYFIGEHNDVNLVIEKVQDIINHHDFLSIKYWKSIKVVSDFEIHTLIPKEDFNSSRIEEFIEIIFPTITLKDFDFKYVESKKEIFLFGTYRKINSIFTGIYDTHSLEIVSTLSSAFEYLSKQLYNICIVSETFTDILKYNTRTEQISIKRYFLDEELPHSDGDVELYGELTPFGRNYHKLASKFQNLKAGRAFHEQKLIANFSQLSMQRYFILFANL